MDPGDPERPLVQGGAGPHHRSRAHHRHRPRLLSVSPHPREAAEERLTQDKGAVDAAGPVDAQHAPTGPWITADGYPQAPTAIIGYVKRCSKKRPSTTGGPDFGITGGPDF